MHTHANAERDALVGLAHLRSLSDEGPKYVLAEWLVAEKRKTHNLSRRIARLYEDKRTLERELMRLQREANERSE